MQGNCRAKMRITQLQRNQVNPDGKCQSTAGSCAGIWTRGGAAGDQAFDTWTGVRRCFLAGHATDIAGVPDGWTNWHPACE
jgi:hypothetical protein